MSKSALESKGLLQILQKIIPSDLVTPVSAFMQLRPLFSGKPAFLFESVERGEQVGRFSILGFSCNELLRWNVENPGHPLALLSERLKQFSERFGEKLPFPYGSFGYLSFDAVRAFETLSPPKGKSTFPDAYFIVPERMILFDHVRNTMTLLALCGKNEEENPLHLLEKGLQTPPAPNEPSAVSSEEEKFTASETRETFTAKVRKAQDYIKAGEIYQVVLSQQIRGKTSAKPVDIYRALRILNPSPYMFYLDFNQFQMIGSSPEMLVKVTGGIAQTRPIAGTRPRGENVEEDEELTRELARDPKERAEHMMLVDLGRNDLGRVCKYGTVKVTQLMEIERYSHVMHMVSTVEGNLSGENTPLDVLQATFPAGTVSGAPKIRAMEIIDELEGIRRGPYAGCVGYLSFSGDLDTCITIRTLVMRQNEIILQTGAGIVSDSNPDREYEETLSKGEGMKQAVFLAESGFRLDPSKWKK